MVLETTKPREYYLAIAEGYPLFEDVIKGNATLVKWLDCIVEDGGNNPKEESAVRLEVLCELYKGEVPSNADMPRESLNKFLAGIVGYVVGGYYAPVLVGMAAMTFIPPPLGMLIGASLIGLGGPIGSIVAPFIGTAKRWERLRNKRKQILQPLYSIADSLDADISRCFILEDFEGCRDRFELTYRSLSGEEREVVDAHLYAFLGAGGIPGMDEQQLKGYLTELLVQEQKGGA